jgi:RND family efflux transporter MFP subunit
MTEQHWKKIIINSASLLAILLITGACSSKVEDRAQPAEQGMPLAPGAAIHTVKRLPLASRIPVVGTVMSEETVSLSARIPATVSRVLAVTGSKVRRGETLVVLDDRDIKEQLSTAEAQFKQAQAEYHRAQRLMSVKATTEQAMVAAESGFNAARAQWERAKVMLSYATVTSPMDGIVTERRVEAGDLAAPGQVLVSIYDPLRMRLECAVPVRLVNKLPQGKEVDVILDRPATAFKGQVTEIVSEVDAATRTQKVKVRLQTTAGDILPGTFGRLWIEDDATPTICVPASAIYNEGQLEMAQVVQDNRVFRRLMKTGAVRGDQIEVLSGLDDGDNILVNPVK